MLKAMQVCCKNKSFSRCVCTTWSFHHSPSDTYSFLVICSKCSSPLLQADTHTQHSDHNSRLNQIMILQRLCNQDHSVQVCPKHTMHFMKALLIHPSVLVGHGSQPCAWVLHLSSRSMCMLLQGLRWSSFPVDSHQFPKLRLKFRQNLISLAGGMTRLPITDPKARPSHNSPVHMLLLPLLIDCACHCFL